MNNIKYTGYLFVFFFLSINSQAQHISFESLLEGVNNPMGGSFYQELKDNNFTMVSPYKSRIKPEVWGYNYDSRNGSAQSWVHYYFDKSVFEKKKRKNITLDITISTFGEGNQLHGYLVNKIKENCKPAGQVIDEIQNDYFDEYHHSSGAYFRTYSVEGENYIKVHNSIKIEK